MKLWQEPALYEDRLITYAAENSERVVLVGQDYSYVLDEVPASFSALQQGPYKERFKGTTQLLWLSVDKNSRVTADFRFLIMESEADEAGRAWLAQHDFTPATAWHEKGQLGVTYRLMGYRQRSDATKVYEGLSYGEKRQERIRRPSHVGDIAAKVILTPFAVGGDVALAALGLVFIPALISY